MRTKSVSFPDPAKLRSLFGPCYAYAVLTVDGDAAVDVGATGGGLGAGAIGAGAAYQLPEKTSKKFWQQMAFQHLIFSNEICSRICAKIMF